MTCLCVCVCVSQLKLDRVGFLEGNNFSSENIGFGLGIEDKTILNIKSFYSVKETGI